MNDCTNAGRLQAQAADRFRKILADIITERSRQDAKFGEQNHSPQDWLMILMEEVGEFARAHMEVVYSTTATDLDAKRRHLRQELVQVAAVAVAMLESADRNNWSPQ